MVRSFTDVFIKKNAENYRPNFLFFKQGTFRISRDSNSKDITNYE